MRIQVGLKDQHEYEYEDMNSGYIKQEIRGFNLNWYNLVIHKGSLIKIELVILKKFLHWRYMWNDQQPHLIPNARSLHENWPLVRISLAAESESSSQRWWASRFYDCFHSRDTDSWEYCIGLRYNALLKHIWDNGQQKVYVPFGCLWILLEVV